jgi:hypothetical protein
MLGAVPSWDDLIAHATVDCYNDSECVTGFYTMLEVPVPVPVPVEVPMPTPPPDGAEWVEAYRNWAW